MRKYSDERQKIRDDTIAKGRGLQNLIKSHFAKDDNFRDAAEETDNQENNNLLLEVFGVFGDFIKALTGDYTNQVENQKTLDELKAELHKALEDNISEFGKTVEAAIDRLVESTLKSIEDSDFLTEIITNPAYSGKKAGKELERL